MPLLICRSSLLRTQASIEYAELPRETAAVTFEVEPLNVAARFASRIIASGWA